jgi:hypothetical protein
VIAKEITESIAFCNTLERDQGGEALAPEDVRQTSWT